MSIALLAVLTVAPPAAAQDPPPTEPDSVIRLQPLVVTARRREEFLQDIPLAVSAFSGRELELRGIESTDQLGSIAPNLSFNSSGAFSGTKASSQIYIRGVGQRDYIPLKDPGVAVYVDGIYMPRTVGTVLDLLEIERVEVLRGPQGTLFGRNAVGGAVTIHSRMPDAEPRRTIRAQVGDDRMTNLSAAVNGALADGLFGGVTVALRKRDGYVMRVYDGLDMGDDNGQAVRGSLVWTPSESLRIFASADYSRKRENGAPTVNGGVNDKMALATFGNGALASCEAITVNPNFPGKGPPTFPPPGVGAGGAEGCYGPDSFAGHYVSEGTFPVFADLDSWGGGAEVAWTLGDWGRLRSLTGYRGLVLVGSRDADNTPANILQNEIVVESFQISQEIQISAVALDERLHWQTGFYLVREDGFNRTGVTLPTGSFDSDWDIGSQSVAGFAQATADLTEALSLTVGARYTRDRKMVTPDVFVLGDASHGRRSPYGPTWPLAAGIYRAATGPMKQGDRMLPNREFSDDFDALTTMANVAYRLNDDAMAYFGFAEGFKSGGYDSRHPTPPPGHEPNSPDAAPSSFDPETVSSYEVGVKSQWGEGRLKLNLALFRANYQDMHIVVRQSINPITINGGSADLSGAELEVAWIPARGWDVVGHLGTLRARYEKISEGVLSSNTPIYADYKLAKTPALGHSLAVGRRMRFGGRSVTPRIAWSFTGSQYHDAGNTPQLFHEGYHLLNASITLISEDGKWELVHSLRNLTDERYLVTGVSAFGTAAAYIEQVWGRPFEWSVALQRRW